MRASAASPVGKREAGGGRPQLTSATATQKEPARAARGRENTGNTPGFETTAPARSRNADAVEQVEVRHEERHHRALHSDAVLLAQAHEAEAVDHRERRRTRRGGFLARSA